MDIKRKITNNILDHLLPNKAVVINGARRTGKTYLLKSIIKNLSEPHLILNGEDILTHELLSRRTAINYKNMLGNNRILIIDEAQKIDDIGLKIKLMIDEISGLKVILTGSSAFDLHRNIGEPLTGRKFNFTLQPFSELEYDQIETRTEKIENLKERLVFGNYPELIHIGSREGKKEYLRQLIDSYLLKDILAYENLRSSHKILELLRLIAFQVGNEVSFSELANKLSINKATVERYLDILTKVYILHRLGGYSGNLRKEVTKSSKWYFIDNGIRNAIIANFAPIYLRDDIGRLWENYIISERLKYQSTMQLHSNNYFWRTYDGQEIDWVEERDGGLFAFEFKWNDKPKKAPPAWAKSYPESVFRTINPGNYIHWLEESEND